jgi:hypothetical protein
MTYYRVKAEFDGYSKYEYIGNTYKVKSDSVLVGEELYTPAERKKIANADKFFEQVNISQRKTYWFFGARFEMKEVNIK